METLPLWAWGAFLIFIIAMLALDLGVFHRKSHTIHLREALTWCGVWFSLAMVFCVVVWTWLGPKHGMEWLTGYVVEIALSVDNVFVFIVIFTYFKVPAEYQHRVLFWGIVGAAVLRFVFIVAGVSLLARFHWLIYVFGAFLVYTGIKLALPQDDEFDPEQNFAVRLLRKVYPVSNHYHGRHFFTTEQGIRMATPLFVVLLVIETTDVAFALDSIPAVLAITDVPFIVFTSNIFAILGLRAIYFALNGVMGMFRFLNVGLAVILSFIGVKMLVSAFYHISVGISLGVIGGVLALAVGASLLFPAKKDEA
ncbi:TerC family protein [Actomonas aquatica]|uniref:TerC family protein n=1 Tax=Actomonas aquatica TaxID=2866162 RepID=A0ABZ1C3D9_9BACT|nr:TerC family protein [Opitutus sp. WL0086]WRQ86233.1 TerC family protein [Opitutus sp. WL0086]